MCPSDGCGGHHAPKNLLSLGGTKSCLTLHFEGYASSKATGISLKRSALAGKLFSEALQLHFAGFGCQPFQEVANKKP